ncbi:flagella synthesis protein FlgN [Dyella tabacisoli]|uniref:Flagellar protein FlgN n=1 Tax=Dyella tabacisoli TaxID=2282381 RepID=A0A369UQN3_9GAMM|nr:flagellar protein FlgN [Dyella tabacisoli]RDD82633.1 flagellar protein FlgN [Dyella tabacisoli]
MDTGLQVELSDTLSAVIGDMRQAVAQLNDALGAERAALNRADAEALDRAGEAKQALMRRLEQLDVERVQLTQNLQTPSSQQQEAWADVLQTLAACQHANQRNGSIVGQQLSQIRHALSVLTGGKDEANLYGPAGILSGGYRSLPLAEA